MLLVSLSAKNIRNSTDVKVNFIFNSIPKCLVIIKISKFMSIGYLKYFVNFSILCLNIIDLYEQYIPTIEDSIAMGSR